MAVWTRSGRSSCRSFLGAVDGLHVVRRGSSVHNPALQPGGLSRAGSAEEGLVSRRAAVAQELSAALGLGGLADAVGRPGKSSQRSQEAAVGLVLPGDGAVALPAVSTQQVEAAVVADPGVGVAGEVVGTLGQRLLGERSPRRRRLRVGPRDVRGSSPPVPARRPPGRRAGASGAARPSGPGTPFGPLCLARSTSVLWTLCKRHDAGQVSITPRYNGRGQPDRLVPVLLRFSQAVTTRAAMPASAALPQARGS